MSFLRYEKKLLLAWIIGIFFYLDINSFASPSANLRYLSLALRDELPSVSEVLALENGEKTIEEFVLEWTNSLQYKNRIYRYFNDMFGVSQRQSMRAINNFRERILHVSADNIYFLQAKGECTSQNAVSAPAWWLEQGQTIKICPSALSSDINFVDGTQKISCVRNGPLGMQNAKCGCGPFQIACFPNEASNTISKSIKFEFAERALYVYNENLSWQDLFAGNFFYGNRWLYHYYLWQQLIKPTSTLPSEADISALMAIPLNSYIRANFPKSPQTTTRAGLVTQPGFLRQYNNMRSRIRALVNQLLCKDVDSSLNTSGISKFINPSLSAKDIEHSSNPSCSGCHLGMDNMASALISWNNEGFFIPKKDINETAHVFGIDGSGPVFLMKTFIEYGTEFYPCMAKRVWEDFSGTLWNDLPSDIQQTFTAAATTNPTKLFQEITQSSALQSIRNIEINPTDNSDNPNVDDEKINFSETINPILNQSCSGDSCHSIGTNLGVRYEFIDNESNFLKAEQQKISNGSMPPRASGKVLSSQEKELLLRFLSQ